MKLKITEEDGLTKIKVDGEVIIDSTDDKRNELVSELEKYFEDVDWSQDETPDVDYVFDLIAKKIGVMI